MADTRSPLNINFFVQFVYKQGTYFRFHNLAIGLQNLGHNVTIWGTDFSLRKNQVVEEYRDGVKYNIIAGNKLQSVFGQPAHPFTTFRRASIKYPASDINHMFQPFFSVAVPWLKNKSNTRLSVYDWDDLWTGGIYSSKSDSVAESWSKFWVKYCENTMPSKANLVTVCSEFLKERSEERGAKEIEIVYNGYWPVKELPDKTLVRKELGLVQDAKYFGFMGRTHAEINWCYEGMRGILSSDPSVRLAICGSGAYILDDVELELKSRIDYLGMLSPEKADLFARAIDVGLLPLEDEPFNRSRFPIKLANYQAMGTNVLFSDIGQSGIVARSLPWNINAGKTKQSWTEAFHTVNKLLVNNELQEIDFSALEKILSWQNIASKLETAYYKHLQSK